MCCLSEMASLSCKKHDEKVNVQWCNVKRQNNLLLFLKHNFRNNKKVQKVHKYSSCTAIRNECLQKFVKAYFHYLRTTLVTTDLTLGILKDPSSVDL